MKRAPLAWILIGIFILVIGWLQYLKLRTFGYNGLDLGIYTNVLWSLSHGYGFASSIHDPSYLGDHLELWLVPLAGLFRLWPDPLLLLWIQTLALGLAAWPLGLLAKRLGGQSMVIPTVILWLVHPLLFNAALYEFHALTLAAPVIAWSILAYQQKRYRLWVALLVATALAREDLPLLLLGWAGLAAVDRRAWRWWLIPAGLGIVWFLGAQFIISSHNPLEQYKYLAFYGWLGSTPVEIITFPFRHPLVFVSHLFHPNNWYTVILVSAGFGFLPWWSKRQLIPLSLLFVQLLLLSSRTDSIVHIHYLIPYLPFFIWSTLTTVVRLRAGELRWSWVDKGIVTPVSMCLIAAGLLQGLLSYGPLTWPWAPAAHQGKTPPSLLRQAVDDIKPTDRVLTTFSLLPHLASRQTVYSLNYVYLGRRQYTESPYTIPGPIDVAVIDWQQLYHYQFFYKTTLYQGLTGAQRIEALLKEHNLHLVRWIDSIAVYRRDGAVLGPITERLSNLSPTNNIQALGPLELVEEPTLEPIGTQGNSEFGYFEQPIELTFQLNKKITEPLSIRFDLLQNSSTVWSSTRLLGQGTLPAVEWEPGQYRARYRLAIPENLRGESTLNATVLRLEGNYRPDRLLQFRPVVSLEQPLGTITLGSISL